MPALDGVVPVEGHGRAFEDGDEGVDEEVERADDEGAEEQVPEPCYHGEDAVVEEEQGGFDGHGAGEVEDLDGEEDLGYESVGNLVNEGKERSGTEARGGVEQEHTLKNRTSCLSLVGPPDSTVCRPRPAYWISIQ